MKKLVIDEAACLCCGSCSGTCEEVFGWSESGAACVKDQEAVKEHEKEVQAAINACPTGAIKFVEVEETEK